MKSLERLNKIEEFYQKLIIDLYLKLQISKWEKDAIYDKYKDDFEQIKANLEVLEIIKNKKVEVGYLLRLFDLPLSDAKVLDEYNKYFIERTNLRLTLEELLKIKQWLEENEK